MQTRGPPPGRWTQAAAPVARAREPDWLQVRKDLASALSHDQDPQQAKLLACMTALSLAFKLDGPVRIFRPEAITVSRIFLSHSSARSGRVACPPVTRKFSERALPSTIAWILMLRPPRLMPTAHLSTRRGRSRIGRKSYAGGYAAVNTDGPKPKSRRRRRAKKKASEQQMGERRQYRRPGSKWTAFDRPTPSTSRMVAFAERLAKDKRAHLAVRI